MSGDGWYTTEDVVQFLAATGTAVSDTDISSSLIVGDRPPPPLRVPEDNEAALMFGGDYYNQDPFDNEVGKPDLKGITAMIRMLESLNETEETARITPNENVVTISKLNPNVPEFVPRDVSKNVDQPKKVVTKKCRPVINGHTDNFNDKIVPSIACTNVDKLVPLELKTRLMADPNIDTKFNTSTMSPEDIEILSKELKSRFINASKGCSLKTKRDKNAAIATLLKLHSSSPNLSLKSSDSRKENRHQELEQTPILYTPDYFKKGLAGVPITTNSTEQKYEATGSELESATVEQLDVQNELTECKSADDIRKTTTVVNEELKVSIHKVEEWLNKPIKNSINKPSKSIYLGPVIFKRKEQSSSPGTTEKKRRDQCKVYKPSKFADELAHRYRECCKPSEPVGVDLWHNLKAALKKRDQEIKNKTIDKTLK